MLTFRKKNQELLLEFKQNLSEGAVPP